MAKKTYLVEDELDSVHYIADKEEYTREMMEVWVSSIDEIEDLWKDENKYDLNPALVKRYRTAKIAFFSVRRELERAMKESKVN